MAHMQYLIFNNENIPKPASYSIGLSNGEADSGGMTEAGTTQRDIVREGVVEIQVSFNVSKRWLQKLSAYKKLAKHHGGISGHCDHEHRGYGDVY